jgi:Ca2+-binding EF-hand superfamily protein
VQDMYTLDPLLESLMNYASDEDLTHKLKSLFQKFDLDEDSVITYQEMYEGLYKLKYEPPIALPLQEYELITQDCTVNGDLSFSGFSAVLREQLRLFCQETILKGSLHGKI